MQVFGYSKRVVSDEGLLEMKEVAIAADPKVLRTIASFILAAAAKLEEGEFDHEHLQFHWDEWEEGQPDIVVANPKLVK